MALKVIVADNVLPGFNGALGLTQLLQDGAGPLTRTETCGVKVHYAGITSCLQEIWPRDLILQQGPPQFQCGALLTELPLDNLVLAGCIENPTSCVSNRRSTTELHQDDMRVL